MDFNFLPWLHDVFATLPGGELAWTVLSFVIVLSILVFFHELGHYGAARSVGVGIEAFSIGFGKEIFGWFDKHGTRWKVCMVPLGGYVKMVGEDTNEDDKKAYEKGTAFFEKHVLARIWVVFAGPLANFVLAFVFLSSIFMTGEREQVPLDETQPVIGVIADGMPAQEAGLQVGDKILSINGIPTPSFGEAGRVIAGLGGTQSIFMISRDGATLPVLVTPKQTERFNQITAEPESRGLVGIGPEAEIRIIEHSFGGAIVAGFDKTVHFTTLILKTIWAMIGGHVASDSVGGPIMIADMASQSAQTGGYELFLFMAVISINLGLINLFPVPMLDGGHLVYYFIELVKGSPVSDTIQGIGQKIGLALLASLMVFAFYNDIARLVQNL